VQPCLQVTARSSSWQAAAASSKEQTAVRAGMRWCRLHSNSSGKLLRMRSNHRRRSSSTKGFMIRSS
jgi:hypothetical protein